MGVGRIFSRGGQPEPYQSPSIPQSGVTLSEGTEIQSRRRGGFCGLSRQNKTSTPKLKYETQEISEVFINQYSILRVVHSHCNLCLSGPIPWDVSHGIPIGMTFPWASLGLSLSVPFPSHSNLCLSHPMGRFPWDSHTNDIPMDKLVYSVL